MDCYPFHAGGAVQVLDEIQELPVIRRFFRFFCLERLSAPLRSRILTDFVPDAQNFGHAPCLGEASPRRKRCLAVENFTQATQTSGGELVGHGLQDLHSLIWIAIDPEVGQAKWTQQPAPNGALMVGAVALSLVATIMALVLGLGRGQAAQTVRGQQVPGTGVDDRSLSISQQRALR